MAKSALQACPTALQLSESKWWGKQLKNESLKFSASAVLASLSHRTSYYGFLIRTNSIDVISIKAGMAVMENSSEKKKELQDEMLCSCWLDFPINFQTMNMSMFYCFIYCFIFFYEFEAIHTFIRHL